MKHEEIKHLLPGVFQRALREGNPLAAILDVMETLHAPAEQTLAALESNFDPRRAPDRFVPFLARWLDVDRFFESSHQAAWRQRGASQTPPKGVGRVRELVASAAYLSQWRGTSKGLLLLLETTTGVRGFEIDERVAEGMGPPKPFHFALRGPAEAVPFRALIEKIIESEKPAYVTYRIELGEKKADTG